MKRKCLVSFIVLALMLTITPQVRADDSIKVMLNGNQLSFDVQPVIIDERLLVPLSGIFKPLGATFTWDPFDQTVVAYQGDNVVSLTIGSYSAEVNGETIDLDVPATIIDGRAMVPLRIIAKALKCYVNYDANSNVVVLQTVSAYAGNNIVFVVGKKEFQIDGQTFYMDVSPYLKNGAVYMPFHYVWQVLGVSSSNAIWDDAVQSITLMKGDKVVQTKIGSNTMLVNGAAITLDYAPEVKDGRAFIPVALLCCAFGATTSWDAATQTITITNN
ncbi:MAG: copper amine oxidase N-terminal domain-containing protein [Syntrophomonadaceae bacterium]